MQSFVQICEIAREDLKNVRVQNFVNLQKKNNFGGNGRGLYQQTQHNSGNACIYVF